MTKSAALEAAGYGVRVNAVAPGPTDTGMLTRFTGAPENKAALVAGVPMGRAATAARTAEAATGPGSLALAVLPTIGAGAQPEEARTTSGGAVAVCDSRLAPLACLRDGRPLLVGRVADP